LNHKGHRGASRCAEKLNAQRDYEALRFKRKALQYILVFLCALYVLCGSKKDLANRSSLYK